MNKPDKQKTQLILNKQIFNVSYLGNIDLLNTTKISVTGTRKPTELALDILIKYLTKLVPKYTIVSGYANGSDEMAHYKALQYPSGKTIIILPTGINHFYVKSFYKQVWDWKKALVLSQFPDNSEWSSRNAFARNELIVLLSDNIISVHPGMKGGTFNATQLALKYKKKIWITDSNSDGLNFFYSKGAKKLLR